MNRLLDGSPGAGEALLVDRQLLTTGVDRLAQSHDREVRQLLRDHLEPSSDLVELSCHVGNRTG